MPQAPTDVLPNLFIIGAAKSGTTSLHGYLDAHPEISMSDPKEPRVFADPEWRDRVGEYTGMLSSPTAPVRGESSTFYTRFPIAREVPERVASKCPEARFIYVVRDPVERVVANWVQRYSQREEHRTLAGALANLDAPRNRYVAASRYATQLERWLRCFSRERILVVDQAGLRADRAQTLLEILRFLEVEPKLPANIDVELNVGETKEGMTAAAARAWSALQPATRRLPPRARASLARSPLFPAEKIGKPSLDDGLRARLEAELGEEADRFRALTGMEFASWSI